MDILRLSNKNVKERSLMLNEKKNASFKEKLSEKLKTAGEKLKVAGEKIKEKASELGEIIDEKKDNFLQKVEMKREIIQEHEDAIKASKERRKAYEEVIKEKKRQLKEQQKLEKHRLKEEQSKNKHTNTAERRFQQMIEYELSEKDRIKKREALQLGLRESAIIKAEEEYQNYKKKELIKIFKENISNLTLTSLQEDLYAKTNELTTIKILVKNVGIHLIRNISLEINEPRGAELLTKFFFIESLIGEDSKEFQIYLKPVSIGKISINISLSLRPKFTKDLRVDIKARKPKKNRVICSKCGIYNPDTSHICKKCKNNLNTTYSMEESSNLDATESNKKMCPFCGGLNEEFALYCYNCGSTFS